MNTFLFGSFLQGESYCTIRPNGREDYLLIITLDGAGLVRMGDASIQQHPGDVVLFRPGAFQHYQTCPTTRRWELAFAHFQPRPHWLTLLQWPDWRPGVAVVSLFPEASSERVNRVARDMAASAVLPGTSSLQFALLRLEECLLWTDMSVRRDDAVHIDSRIHKAMDRLTTHLSEPFSLLKISRTSGLSPSRFSHLFREQIGMTPQRFAEEVRMERALYLLRDTQMRISEIAAQCGYQDALYFSRRFKKQFGESPVAYRKSNAPMA